MLQGRRNQCLEKGTEIIDMEVVSMKERRKASIILLRETLGKALIESRCRGLEEGIKIGNWLSE